MALQRKFIEWLIACADRSNCSSQQSRHSFIVKCIVIEIRSQTLNDTMRNRTGRKSAGQIGMSNLEAIQMSDDSEM